MRLRILRPDPSRGAPAALLPLVILLIALRPAFAACQFQDARQPIPGHLWFEITPVLTNWSEQFAASSLIPGVADGDREPLFRDYDGPIASRLFPGPQAMVDGLNTDAAALGFAPLVPGEFSLGDFDFGTINAQRRNVQLGFELGVLGRVSVEARAPLVFTEVEPALRYDSTAATMFAASTVFTVGSSFFTELGGALSDLQALIDGGTLDPTQLAAAIALRDGAAAFLAALEARTLAASPIPTAPSRAGTEMLAHYDALSTGFAGFGVPLPAFSLPDVATSADLAVFFGDPVRGMIPGLSERGWGVGAMELGIRLGLFDGISPEHSVAADEVEPAGRTVDAPPGEEE
ncbi:MAG: hypothetical protein ACRELC_12520, partial [Gemmatimonadota bacterium]